MRHVSPVLHVRPGVLDRRKGLVHAALRCALGRGGTTPAALKREGDGKTPLGDYRIVELRYRPDRTMRPRTRLPVKALRPSDGWCDDPRELRTDVARRRAL